MRRATKRFNYHKVKTFIKKTLYAIIKFFSDWRTAVSFLLAWMITNGWGYTFIILGNLLNIKWMVVVGTSYIAFLWMPFTAEALITIPLALFIKRILFKKGK